MPVWLFHPAKRDAVSEQFYLDPNTRSSACAEERHREYELLTDRSLIGGYIREAGILTTTYSTSH